MIARFTANCYALRVRNWIALLMLGVMLLSHGSMGEGAPHPYTRDLTHTNAHDPHALQAHHLSESNAADAAGSEDGQSENAGDYAIHAHVTGDLARPADWLHASFPVSGQAPVIRSVSALPSRGVAPLLEPPSA